ncbi:NAD(P)H-dependent oxidoreductase [Ferruginivarius sediminum]|uniref:Flavodoxin family protein n=1 Tax=Ferruginivarius sediminum TaxID=2661937 RepID=A0A369T9N9_9PROT|nr:NAD(P)H-dependent oxidoreductase [Ferruginivarius sediminum]RDD61095.1 flavodoxin family protein [Ferruginivarius sediminum]
MHVLVVHAHPEPTSFNATLKNVAVDTLKRQGHSVEVSDLYAEGFDPAEKPEHYDNRVNVDCFSPLAEQRNACQTGTLPGDVHREIARLERADLVVFQFPLWWHAQPAILKGWFDRVFVSGGLYTSSMRYDQGYFRGKRAICSVTTGAPAETFEPNGRGGDIELLLWPIQFSLYYMGFDVLPPFIAFAIQGHGFGNMDEDSFKQQLERQKAEWASRLENAENTRPLPFPGWNDWDEIGRPKPEGRSAEAALRFMSQQEGGARQ